MTTHPRYLRRLGFDGSSFYSYRRLSHRTQQSDAQAIFQHAVRNVCPDQLIRNSINIESGHIQIGECLIDSAKQKVHVVAFGKAVIGMVAEAHRILSDRLHDGIAIVPKGIKAQLRRHGKEVLIPQDDCQVRLYEGAHLNIPDSDCVAASNKVKDLVTKLDEKDVLLTLISGGGSALLSLPKDPLTLPDLRKVTKMLSTNGATISELNTVRQHLEQLKGGGLSSLAAPAQVISLILSDVVGDPLNFIASGPTVEDETTPGEALKIMLQYVSQADIPPAVFEVLKSPKSSSINRRVSNKLIGTNKIALQACAQKARDLGYSPIITQSNLTGDAQQASRDFASLALRLTTPGKQLGVLTRLFDSLTDEDRGKAEAELAEWSQLMERPLCLLSGGETTVNVTGSGKGGRNQEMALKFALELSSHPNVNRSLTFTSLGTDGQDGPTEAAGATVTNKTLVDEIDINVAVDYLQNNDSNTFFNLDRFDDCLITTGLTGTNVMDIQMLLIDAADVNAS